MTAELDPHDEYVATKAWDSTVMRRLMRYAVPHKRLFVGSFGVLIGLFALQIVGPWIIRAALDGPIADALRERELLGEASDSAPHLWRLARWTGLFVLVTLVATVFHYWEVSQLARTGQAVIHDLRTHLFRHIQRMHVSWFDRRPTGALVTRVTSDIEHLNELFTSGLVVLLFDLIKIVVLLGLLFWVSAKLALLVLVLTPLLIGVSLVFRGGARRAHRTVRARLARLNGFLQEVLSGVRVVQYFQREKRVSDRFGDHLDAYLRANFKTILLFALFFPIVGLLTTSIQGSIVWAGGGSIASGALTIGDFILFWFLLQYLLRPIRELGERYNVLQSAFASAERIFDILDSEPRLTAPAEPRALPSPFGAHVRFEKVAFGYSEEPDDSPVVEDVDFEIRPGQTLALVGATGAGKSTLVSLLLRYYDPTRGRITVDGVDLRELDLEAFQRRLGIVLQEDYLFTGTIRDNLALGREWVDEASIARAIEISAADTVIGRLGGGLEAVLAERGATLSTGERELLSIARALAGDPGLVILDEATSSVDSATEARIEEATHNLLRDRSALVVAHRLSTVRRADRILVMHHGRVRESGVHEELLALGGIYARLHALQFRDAAEAG